MPDATAAQPAAATPPAAKPDTASQPQDGLSSAEERQLGDLLAKRDQAGQSGQIRLRVEGHHSSITVGHVTVGRDWTPVPAHAVAALMEGAADAGVILTQEES